jgi:lipocalin
MRPSKAALPLTEVDPKVFFNTTWYEQYRTSNRYESECVTVSTHCKQEEEHIAIDDMCFRSDYSALQAPLMFAKVPKRRRRRDSGRATYDLDLFGFGAGQLNVVYASHVGDAERGTAVIAGRRWKDISVWSRCKAPKPADMSRALQLAQRHAKLTPTGQPMKTPRKSGYVVKD